VKQSINLDDFFLFLSSADVIVNNKQKQQFQQYLDILLHWSQKQNLISRDDTTYIVERHFLPSAFLAKKIYRQTNLEMLDVGSGAGFPGIVVAILKPDIKLTLIDSSRKKHLFLTEICEVLGINAEIICERMDSFVPVKEKSFDYIISRAVTSLKNLWCWSNSLLIDKGKMIAIKGGNLDVELSGLAKINVRVQIIEPDQGWLQFSKNLENKKFVLMEKKYV
jgi:16S rRNA (guanine527-N7)-methyltransferase